jgi:hypothetical protein
MRPIPVALLFVLSFSFAPFAPASGAEEKTEKEKAYYGTIVAMDMNNGVMKLITNDGVMVDLAAEGKAAKHLDKIPLNTLIDIKVEMREGALPLIQSWKMAQAQSPCRIFDGKMCTP